MLELKNITMSFGDHTIIKDYSYSFKDDNIYCILGKSGVGKTTLLRIASGLLKPDSGKVLLDGEEVTKPTEDITMMHQSYNNFPFLNSLRNVALPQKLAGEKVDWNKCREYLNIVGIPPDKMPHEMSGGMNQRLALARMLNTRHKVCLMDEPLSALDSITRASMQQFIKEFNKKQKNIMIIITHDVDEADVLTTKDKIIRL